jgi:hypothetical protein
MEWAQFQRDHHRPHLLVVSVAARKASDPPTEAPDLERLAVRLGAAGNYAFTMEGTTLLAAFEDDGDAERFAQVFKPTQVTRESEWASKAWARMDDTTLRRISDILRGAPDDQKAKIFATLASIGPPYSCDASWRRQRERADVEYE